MCGIWVLSDGPGSGGEGEGGGPRQAARATNLPTKRTQKRNLCCPSSFLLQAALRYKPLALVPPPDPHPPKRPPSAKPFTKNAPPPPPPPPPPMEWPMQRIMGVSLKELAASLSQPKEQAGTGQGQARPTGISISSSHISMSGLPTVTEHMPAGLAQGYASSSANSAEPSSARTVSSAGAAQGPAAPTSYWWQSVGFPGKAWLRKLADIDAATDAYFAEKNAGPEGAAGGAAGGGGTSSNSPNTSRPPSPTKGRASSPGKAADNRPSSSGNKGGANDKRSSSPGKGGDKVGGGAWVGVGTAGSCVTLHAQKACTLSHLRLIVILC